MDFYPTALDAAGIKLPSNLDGTSLIPYMKGENKKNPHDSLVWITSYSHWFDEQNIPFWDGYHKYVREESAEYPFNPNTEDLSQFSWTVRNDTYSLTYTFEDKHLALYTLDDLAQKIISQKITLML